MTWTLCLSGSAIVRGGAGANSNIISYIGAYKTELDNFSDETEAWLSSRVRGNIIDKYSTITVNGKKVLQLLAANMVARKIINYDMSGYTSLGEATTMLNVIEGEINDCLKIVDDDNWFAYAGLTRP